MTKAEQAHERIAKAAYHLWINEGRPHGRDVEHWRAAEAAVQARKTKARGKIVGVVAGIAGTRF